VTTSERGADKGQVLPIDPYVAQDGVDLSIYQKGLADRWIGADGKRYGLPKDWDTEVYFYNSALR
jgi:multiple sugar transport system substrate-binding protein